MRSNKTKDERRQQEHVEHEEAGKGYRAHFRTAAQQALERSSDHWNVSQDVGAHGGREVGFLIPWQQVAGKGHPQHQSKQYASGKPQQFSASLVRSVEKRLADVQEQYDDDRA